MIKKYTTWIGLAFALAGGVWIGWIDFNNDEPQAAVLAVLVVTFLLGLALPRQGWLWAVVVSSCLPGMYLVLRLLGYQPVSPPSPVWFASSLALIPAFIGAYAGVVLRVLSNTVVKTRAKRA